MQLRWHVPNPKPRQLPASARAVTNKPRCQRPVHRSASLAARSLLSSSAAFFLNVHRSSCGSCRADLRQWLWCQLGRGAEEQLRPSRYVLQRSQKYVLQRSQQLFEHQPVNFFFLVAGVLHPATCIEPKRLLSKLLNTFVDIFVSKI